MTQEDKNLLLIDLSARLPYGVIVEIISYGQENLKPWVGKLYCKDLDCFIHDIAYKSVKPYLRPMSSMTPEEKKELLELLKNLGMTADVKRLDWLVAHHFDIRNLIGKDLAIEVTTENNPYKD